MNNRPTEEELQSGIDQVIEEADTPEEPIIPIEAEENTQSESTEDQNNDESINTELDNTEDQIEDERVEEVEKPKTDNQTPKEPDYKQRYSESTREAQVLNIDLKEFETALDEAENLPEPTDDQVRNAYPEFDTLSDFERKLARETLHAKLINAEIKRVKDTRKEAQTKLEQRSQEIEVFAITPEVLDKFPKLEGKQAEFKLYALKPSRMNIDLEDLAALFSISIPEPIKHKGQMLPISGSGPNEKKNPNTGKINLEQANQLMKTDYKKYKEYLLAGRIINE